MSKGKEITIGPLYACIEFSTRRFGLGIRLLGGPLRSFITNKPSSVWVALALDLGPFHVELEYA